MPRGRRITDEDRAVILDPAIPARDAADRTGRKIATIYRLRSRAGVTRPMQRYTAEEISILRNPVITNREAANLLGRSIASVRVWRSSHHLTKQSHRSWTDDDLAVLDDIKLSNMEVIRRTGHPLRSVYVMRSLRGIHGYPRQSRPAPDHPPQKPYGCLGCGAPTGRPSTRCPNCRKAARSRRNTAYQEVYHAEHRPPPAVRLQPDPGLPPYGQIVTDDTRIQCHVCGRWYGSLVTHIRVHGLDAARYKERYDLPRTSSLLGPQAAERQRQAALARDQGAIGRANIPAGVTRPKGLDNRLGSRITSSERSARRRKP